MVKHRFGAGALLPRWRWPRRCSGGVAGGARSPTPKRPSKRHQSSRRAELAPPYLLQGPTFTVDPQVPIVGMLGHFTIRADVGTFEAHGREMLRIRVGEIHAIAQLDQMSKSDVFLQAAANAVARPVESMTHMLENPDPDGPGAVRRDRSLLRPRRAWRPAARYGRVGAGTEQHRSGRAHRPARGGPHRQCVRLRSGTPGAGQEPRGGPLYHQPGAGEEA